MLETRGAGRYMKNLKLSKNDVIFATKYFTMLVILSFVRAFSNYVFVNSNGFAPGGVGGLAAIIYFAVTKSGNSQLIALSTSLFDPGILTILMNIPFLIVAFLVLNKRLAFNTSIVVLVYSGFMYLLGRVGCPFYQGDGLLDYGCRRSQTDSGKLHGCHRSCGHVSRGSDGIMAV